MLYSYTTSLKANNDTFRETCIAVENNLKGLKKDKPIIDVDGSVTQIYFIGSKKLLFRTILKLMQFMLTVKLT